MFASFLVTLLSLQAAEHDAHKCCCGDVRVTSYIAIVQGPDDAWGGMRPRVRFIPDHVEYLSCPHALRLRSPRP